MEQIEFSHLRCIIAAADHGSFRRAAHMLGIEASAVSRRICYVESCLGTTLFFRHSGGVTPTIAGEKFLSQARQALGHLRNAATEASAFGRGENGSARIGVAASFSSGFIPRLLQEYDARNPKLRMEIIDADPSNHIAAIRRGDIDVAFLPEIDRSKVPDYDVAPLWRERVIIAFQKTQALSERREVMWSDLIDETVLIRDSEAGLALGKCLVQKLYELGHSLELIPCAVQRDGLLQLVAFGRGIGVFNEAAMTTAYPGVAYRPLANETFLFSAVWRPQNSNPAFRRLLSLAMIMAGQ